MSTAKAEDPPTPVGDDKEKARLECEKLRAEIDSIRKPLLKTPAFYAAVLPVVLASLTLLFTWWSGWFDVQRTRISNEKTLVEAQTERLKTERTTLETRAREQQARYAQAAGDIETLRARESDLTNQVARLSLERDEMRKLKELFESEAQRLAGSDTKASEVLREMQVLQANRERVSGELSALQSSNATLLATTAKQTVLIRWANEVLSEGWRIALKDKATWVKFEEFGGHALAVRMASTPYLPHWLVEPDPVTPLKQEGIKTYDDDLFKETMWLMHRAATKSWDDYKNEAKERFELLQRGTSKNDDTNRQQGISSSPPSNPPQNPQSP